jgi:hypothetical protein
VSRVIDVTKPVTAEEQAYLLQRNDPAAATVTVKAEPKGKAADSK